MSLKVQDAAKIASDYLSTLTKNAERIQLEEIEFEMGAPDKWLVTLSYVVMDDDNPFSLSNRKYKILSLNANSGDITSMKIREFR